jgi:hypothetical protein
MSAVQVNDGTGKPLGKVMVGDTKLEALERLADLGAGGLRDKDDLGLLDTELITAEGAPYVFKPLQQQKQVNTVPEEYKQLAAFAKEEMDNKTKHKPMSEASVPFAEEILKGYGFTVAVAPVITEYGSRADPPPYSWIIVDEKSKELKKGEHGGTPGATDWVRDNLLGDDKTFGLKVVTGSMLPKVKANRRSASGKGAIAIGDPRSMAFGEAYLFANGLVELKTDEYPLKTGQNLLELVGLSMVSRFKTGVALLATDCHTKWETFHFSNGRTVQRRIYQHGRKAWEDFMELIKSSETRVFKVKLDTVDEDNEQNLDGFNFGDQESKKMKATQDEAFLERMADHLHDIYGEERPVLPFWARAKSRVPDYYV